jgi:hypothetical protein
VALTLIIALFALCSTSLVKGYTPHVDAVTTVKEVLSGDTFTTTSGATIKLADIRAPQKGEQGFDDSVNFLNSSLRNQLGAINFTGTQVFLDFDSENESKTSDNFLAVAYISYNETFYLNVNEFLRENPSSHVITANSPNDFNPYSWTILTSKNIAIGNSDPTTFENLRIALINSYNAEITSHAGYIVTLIIAIATAIFVLKPHKMSFVTTLAVLSSAIIYFALRIIFWAYIASEVLSITQGQVFLSGQSTDISGLQSILREQFLSIKDPRAFPYLLSSKVFSLDNKTLPFISLILIFFLVFLIIVWIFDFASKRRWISGNWNMHLSSEKKFLLAMAFIAVIVAYWWGFFFVA